MKRLPWILAWAVLSLGLLTSAVGAWAAAVEIRTHAQQVAIGEQIDALKARAAKELRP